MAMKWNADAVRSHAWWALGSLWLAVVLWAFLNGPRLYGERVQQATFNAERENRATCGRLGIPTESSQYMACAIELDGVRRNAVAQAEQALDPL